ncbi:MAG: hypothetical protein DI536_04350 [Archangium gephyra]|uniref:Uncharacterized protein n=1 Tax=Archangium gephyra TaxID=48 RepID=A0A2W5W323_9BACT|nr:MAG: hypothetical protein DI536_04350 [Archangium gephyra]
MNTDELRGFGRYLAAIVRDNASPRTTDDELDAMVEEAIAAHGEAVFLDEAAKDCRCCPSCSGSPCPACAAGGVCDETPCRCGHHGSDSDDEAAEQDDDD